MILLGISPVGRSRKEPFEIMKTFDVRVKRFAALRWSGKKFYPVSSSTLRRGFCCFGNYSLVYPEDRNALWKEFYPGFVSSPDDLERQAQTKKRILDDVAFWRVFMEAYAEHFGTFCLCDYNRKLLKHYPLTERVIAIDEWNEDCFLKLEYNQILAIKKQESLAQCASTEGGLLT